jgi:hypothetical protein
MDRSFDMAIQASFKSSAVAVKDFFQKPQLQKAMKITAIALATLAAMAGAVCVGLFISAPVIFLSIPIAATGIALAILMGKKSSKHVLREDPAMVARVNEARRHLAEAKQAVQESQNVIQNDSQQKYIALAKPIAKEKEALIQKLSTSPQEAVNDIRRMTSQLKSLVNFIDLTGILGQKVMVSHLPEHQELIQHLGQIDHAVRNALESNPGRAKDALEELLQETEAFVAAHP